MVIAPATATATSTATILCGYRGIGAAQPCFADRARSGSMLA